MPKSSQPASQSLSSLIKDSHFDVISESIGQILSLGDGIARVSGLDDIQAGELVDVGQGQFALALNLQKESVGLVLLGTATHLEAGSLVKRTGKILSVGVSEESIGRTLDALGQPID